MSASAASPWISLPAADPGRLEKVEEGFLEARPKKEAQIGRRFNSQQDERLKVHGERRRNTIRRQEDECSKVLR